ncbi:hypothetical protein D1AOALGA4SA_12498 [Olavius algarvensis Delta 1 endosymbiont]|nr:hypothetical protein D1AOALGA4SA_12498 [Olavius algarvensis Delta 1 endosymbiont]
MREIFKYGSAGRALRKQCLYPEPNRAIYADLREFLCRFKKPAPVG